MEREKKKRERERKGKSIRVSKWLCRSDFRIEIYGGFILKKKTSSIKQAKIKNTR